MKLTAKVNGVQQEIELSKEDVYVVECGSVERVNSVLINVYSGFKEEFGWKYASNKPIFSGYDARSKHLANAEPIPPNTPIISFEDWERLMGEKELPKEFTFICDGNSKEQLKKLGVGLSVWSMGGIGYYYLVENNKVIDYSEYPYINSMLINLSDYIDQEEPIQSEQKWQSKTKDGYECHIYEEFDGKILGRLNREGEWLAVTWNINGKYLQELEHSFDLLPIDHNAQRKAEIQAQINKLQEELNSLEK